MFFMNLEEVLVARAYGASTTHAQPRQAMRLSLHELRNKSAYRPVLTKNVWRWYTLHDCGGKKSGATQRCHVKQADWPGAARHGGNRAGRGKLHTLATVAGREVQQPRRAHPRVGAKGLTPKPPRLCWRSTNAAVV